MVITFQNWPRWLLAVITCASVFLVALIDVITGEELSFFVFYFIPVCFAAWNLSLGWAVAAAVLCTIGWLGVETVTGHQYSHPRLLFANTVIRCSSYMLIGLFVAKLKQSRVALAAYTGELEQRVAQRTAKLQERVGEIEMFAYTVSHNLRAPLRAIEGMAHAIEENVAANDAESAGYLARIKSAAVRMDRLILDLIDYVQLTITEPETRPIPLAPLVAEVLAEHRPVIENKSASISLATRLPSVLGNNRMLHSVLYHLVDNALKFARTGEPPAIVISARDADPGWTRVEVRDNGIGISPAHQQRVFWVFEQLHPPEAYGGGTGMGLAFAKKCIEKMGGRIGCESDGTRGSAFWFELRAPAPPTPEIS